jgi:hypothetical protein
MDYDPQHKQGIHSTVTPKSVLGQTSLLSIEYRSNFPGDKDCQSVELNIFLLLLPRRMHQPTTYRYHGFPPLQKFNPVKYSPSHNDRIDSMFHIRGLDWYKYWYLSDHNAETEDSDAYS